MRTAAPARKYGLLLLEIGGMGKICSDIRGKTEYGVICKRCSVAYPLLTGPYPSRVGIFGVADHCAMDQHIP